MKAAFRLRLRKIAVLAHRITSTDSNISQSAAWKYAHDYVKRHEAEVFLLTAVKKSTGKTTTRLVKTWAPKRTKERTRPGRPLKPGQKIFTDVAKEEVGLEYTTVSFYEENILEVA